MLKRRIISVNFIATFELINIYLIFSCTHCKESDMQRD